MEAEFYNLTHRTRVGVDMWPLGKHQQVDGNGSQRNQKDQAGREFEDIGMYIQHLGTQ